MTTLPQPGLHLPRLVSRGGAMRWSLTGKLVLATALLGLLPLSAAVRVVRAPRYRVYSYPVYPVYRPYAYWYDPFYYDRFYYDPFFYPRYYGPPVAYHQNEGEVKLDTKVKDAQVYVDGAYAGTAKQMKTMWLRPGKHDLEIRMPSGATYQQQIYAMNGKTVH